MNKILLTALASATIWTTQAQQRIVTASDYERAEKMLNYNTGPLVDRAEVKPNWLTGDKFWYRVLTAQGSEFILVNPATGSRQPAFDQQKLADALSASGNKKYTANTLPFQSINYTPDGKAIIFRADGKQWKCDLQSYQLTEDNSAVSGGQRMRRSANQVPESVSPDGKKAVFIKDYNLWMRDIASGKLTQLTTDGVKDFGYATDNAGWASSNAAILLWSPDSKKIATYKQDERNVAEMYLVTTDVGHPTLKAWKYPLPGDKEIATIKRVVINVDQPKVIELQIPADPHRSTLSDNIASNGVLNDVNWNADATQLAFVSTSRDHKQEKVRIADATTGAVREVFEEMVPTQFESGQGTVNWRYLPKTNEIIWYSERDNWGHLYLYDAKTGKLKNQMTKGDWTITKLLKVDEQKREVYFLADGREANNPYFTQLCKAGFDGKHFTVLTPEEGNHQVTLSPTGNYFVDTYSKPDVPQITVLRNANGKLVATLEKADISRLKASGWKACMPFTAKAHDGKTDVYGVMFTPTNLDPNKKYPVIDYIYPGPQGGSVGNWSFAASRGDNQALAELGFVVVVLEGTSNPLRSKSFHDMSYGDMSENTIPDQITAIEQLAKRYPYMDVSQVGIWGHSGGGFATATAMLRYPDFFKVGIAESGNHDNRNYEDDWGERYNGLLVNNANGISNYEAQANQNYAKNLKGKLMLVHGLMDNNVPPQNTLLVAEALEKANKSFDLVIFPNSAHGYGPYGPYMMRRRWDYFVQNLLGAQPPQDYLMKPKADPRNSEERGR
ncbi:S9 family peptidase [Mucilaginibacter lacusdianchii]|uniref:S9 family peptidase n=1 Tax=Mucilaginibacter lacusdianchii TaxID=2684211 RepID=UPI00131DD749|nr:S9 family peptidase [Mucilaginibacter sp. JXJ CY 39]